MNTLKDFEKYVIEKEDFSFEYAFELLMFVDKLNEYIVRYYQDIVYSYLLRKRLEKLHGKELSDEKYNELINNDYTGLLLFPSVGTGIRENQYIKVHMNELSKFVDKLDFYNLQYVDIINYAKGKRLFPVLDYSDCVKSARELKEMKNRNVTKYARDLQNELNKSNYSYLYELHDFVNRFENLL